MIIQRRFKVLFNRSLGTDYFKLGVRAPQIARQAQPGQFVHLRCSNSREPLLRRPFSFHRIGKDSFEILYKVIGRGTNLLSKKQKADTIDVLGPLGNGFELLRNTEYGIRNTILVAGGMGVAPLLALAERLVDSVERIADRRRITVLLGARTKKEINCVKDFKKSGVKVQIATDDGSCGYKGLVTCLLKENLRNTQYAIRNTIYACGPKPMLEEVARLSRKFRLPAQGSLEEKMACGVGACLGCTIQTKSGNKLVCNDGPVFDLHEIKW